MIRGVEMTEDKDTGRNLAAYPDTGARAKQIFRNFMRHENAVLGVVLVVVIVALGVVTKGQTLTRNNITNIWIQSASKGVAALGQAFVLISGGLDISIGGIGLVAAIVGSHLMTGQAGFPVVAVGVMFLLGIAFGTLNGTIVSRIGMPALIVTLGMWRITDGIAYMVSGGVTTRNLPQSFYIFGGGKVAGAPVPILILIAVAVVSYLMLNHTTFGRSLYALGGNRISAWLSGVRVRNIELIAYVISGFTGALAGIILTSRVMSGGMGTVEGLEIDSIIAACLGGVSLAGGKGSVIGVVIGVILLGVINNGLNVFAVNPALQWIVKGLLIIAAVAVDYIRRGEMRRAA
jgi:ribose transport system permease protein